MVSTGCARPRRPRFTRGYIPWPRWGLGVGVVEVGEGLGLRVPPRSAWGEGPDPTRSVGVPEAASLCPWLHSLVLLGPGRRRCRGWRGVGASGYPHARRGVIGRTPRGAWGYPRRSRFARGWIPWSCWGRGTMRMVLEAGVCVLGGMNPTPAPPLGGGVEVLRGM